MAPTNLRGEAMGNLSSDSIKFHKLILLLLLISSLFSISLSENGVAAHHQPSRPDARITVKGFVYCDICSNNSFSRHSYFMPGAEVRVDCKFKASSSRTKEQITFSGNRTTNRHGVYKLEVPWVDGIRCAESAIASSCEASLMRTSAKSCNVPGYRSTSDEIAVKSEQANSCIYSLSALSFRPKKIDTSLC